MHSDRSDGYIDERQRREVKLMIGRQLDLCICEIAAGDRDALSRLYLDMKDPIFRFALSLVRSRQLAEDVEAETFLNIIVCLRLQARHKCEGVDFRHSAQLLHGLHEGKRKAFDGRQREP